MPRPARPLPAELGDTFTVHAAKELGVSNSRLRSRQLEHPFQGVRVKRDWTTDRGEAELSDDARQRAFVVRRATAYCELMHPEAFFAGRTAAVLYGAPVSPGEDLTVAMLRPASAPRGRGVRGVKITKGFVSVREHEGFRVSSPASTWAMLGAELTVRELVQVGDALVRVPRDKRGRLRVGAALTTIEQLRAAASAGRRGGAAKLREAVELIRVGSASPLETDYRLDAATAGLPGPELDVEIFASNGRRIGITEIVYREFRTLIEVEGDHHRTNRKQWNRDIEKYAAYVAEGWEIVRLTSAHIRGAQPRAAGLVREVLIRRGWHG
ncbi:hypothetical protein ACWPKO_31190 (plasmid) [Coraliomargarita sp. W4R53]